MPKFFKELDKVTVDLSQLLIEHLSYVKSMHGFSGFSPFCSSSFLLSHSSMHDSI